MIFKTIRYAHGVQIKMGLYKCYYSSFSEMLWVVVGHLLNF